jgi:type VI secretion system protein VasG
LIDTIAKRCTDVDSGARNIYNILTGSLLPEMSGEVLSRMVTGEGIKKVHVSTKDDGSFAYDIK